MTLHRSPGISSIVANILYCFIYVLGNDVNRLIDISNLIYLR